MTLLQIRFGKAVRRLRAKAGFSQERFAAEAGIARAYMGAIERGQVNISLHNVEKIAQALNLTAGQLMTEADKEK